MAPAQAAQAAQAPAQAPVVAQAPTAAQAPAAASPAEASPQAPASPFSMCVLSAGTGKFPKEPRWVVIFLNKVIAFGDDLEEVITQAKAQVDGAIIVFGWDGKRPVSPPEPRAVAVHPVTIESAHDAARLAEALQRAAAGRRGGDDEPDEEDDEDFGDEDFDDVPGDGAPDDSESEVPA